MKLRSLSLTLPFPPSVNTYWRRNGGRYFVARAGKLFRCAVSEEIGDNSPTPTLVGRLRVEIDLFPPDRRRRDIDNFGGKAILDCLYYAGVYEDDEQIDELIIRRQEVSKPGYCTVLVEEI